MSRGANAALEPIQRIVNRTMEHYAGLCEYCACIEFETLSLPSVADLQLLNQGQRPPSRGLFVDANNPNTCMWSLGLQSRIEQSFKTCRLCSAVCLLLQDRASQIPPDLAPSDIRNLLCIAEVSVVGTLRPPKGIKWTVKYVRLRRLSLRWRELEEDEVAEPGQLSPRVERRFEAKFRITQCFQACSPGITGQTRASLLEDSTLSPDKQLAFGGRFLPSMVDPDLPLCWLRRCRHEHGDLCNPQSTFL